MNVDSTPVPAPAVTAAGAIDLFGLRGRTALVTGGGQGLGLAMARALAGQGAAVCLSGRHEETLRAACAGISQDTGAKATLVVADQCERSESRGRGGRFKFARLQPRQFASASDRGIGSRRLTGVSGRRARSRA